MRIVFGAEHLWKHGG